MKSILKISLLLGVILFIWLLTSNVKAASLKVTTSNANPTVGDTFTITVSGGDGVIKSVTSSNTEIVTVESTNWVDREGTKLTAKAVSAGKATITIVPEEVITADEKYITGNGSVTINVKAKQTSSSTESSNQGTSTSGDGSSSTNSGSSNSSSSSNPSKTSASNKTNTNKEAVKNVVQTEQEEEATPQFGMNSLMLNAINENGEKQEITFNPTFNIDTYEYTAEVENNITDIEVVTEAGEYNDYVKIEKPESLNVGENIVKITMQKDDMSLTYTIKVNKKEAETVEAVSDGIVSSDNKEKTLITFTIPQFIVIILTICLIEGLLLKLPWNKMIKSCRRRKGFGESYEEFDSGNTDNELDEENNNEDDQK